MENYFQDTDGSERSPRAHRGLPARCFRKDTTSLEHSLQGKHKPAGPLLKADFPSLPPPKKTKLLPPQRKKLSPQVIQRPCFLPQAPSDMERYPTG